MSYYQESIEKTNQNLVALTPLGRQPIVCWVLFGTAWVMPRTIVTSEDWDWPNPWAVLDCSSGKVFHKTASILDSFEEFEEACK